jgi:hypothetical protein
MSKWRKQREKCKEKKREEEEKRRGKLWILSSPGRNLGFVYLLKGKAPVSLLFKFCSSPYTMVTTYLSRQVLNNQ